MNGKFCNESIIVVAEGMMVLLAGPRGSSRLSHVVFYNTGLSLSWLCPCVPLIEIVSRYFCHRLEVGER